MTLFRRGKALLEAHRLWDVLTYIFFGGLTTAVNIVVFGGCTYLGLNWQFANFIAWILSVLFAFITNKLWVFNSHTETILALVWEFAKFILARVLSLGLDYGCMFLLITVLGQSNMIAKILTQIVIVVANYALSKFIIFKNKPTD